MKKNSTVTKKEIEQVASQQRLTVGLDTGDRRSRYCILDEVGEKVSEGGLATTKAGLNGLFGQMARSRVALEVGTHSPWISRHLESLGHEVIVANAHRVKLITQSVRKNDRLDAEKLARLARVDPKLLSPIRHRGEEAQADLAVIRARAEVMKSRTALINCARGMAKPMGERLKKCDADQVKQSLADGCSEALQKVLRPLLKSVEALSEQIGVYDQQITAMVPRYREVELLTPVYGVGTLIALTYVLTLEDAQRFAHSREVGPYVGLQPKQRDSGERQPELGISKTGDEFLRSMLVQGAHCILRPGAPDCDLRAWGLRKQASGRKAAKRRAVVGVARKLAVLLHTLWANGEVYDPIYNRKLAEAAEASKGVAA